MACQTVYVANADTGAVSEYELPEPVQGMAELGGVFYVATAFGLYALDDVTDDLGVPITWEVRTGFSSFGSDLLKRISDVNVLGHASGDVGVNLVHNRTGDKVEMRYERVRLTRNGSRDGLVKTGRGPISVYWQIAVAGVGPAEIDEIRVRIEPTSRRR